MAVINPPTPEVDFSLISRGQSKNYATTPPVFNWDENLCDELSQSSSPSYVPIDTFMDLSPNSIPYSDSVYTLSSEKSNLDEELVQSFLSGSFENSLSWHNPIDGASSLLVVPPSTALDLNSITTDIDIADCHVMTSGSPGTCVDIATIYCGLDNSSLELEDSMIDKPLSRGPHVLPEIAEVRLHEGLCSNPLLGAQYQLGYGIGMPESCRPVMGAKGSRIRSIAMPTQSCIVSLESASSPEPQDTLNCRHHKSFDGFEPEFPALRGRKEKHKRKAHKIVERRYRTNLNDKIIALRDSVPSLRVILENNLSGEDLRADYQGFSFAHQLNKGTIICKATEYITQLEKSTKRLMIENKTLNARIEAFENHFISQSVTEFTGS